MKITHFVISDWGTPRPSQTAAESPLLADSGTVHDDWSVTLAPTRLPEDELVVALAAQVAANSFLHDPVDGKRAKDKDPAERRATLYDGERVVATATAMENPHAATDWLTCLTEQTRTLTRMRDAVLQITHPDISRVRGLRGPGVSDRSAAKAIGYSHTQVANLRGQRMAPEAVRWRALNLLAEHRLSLPGDDQGLSVRLHADQFEDAPEPRVILAATASGGRAREVVALLERAVAVLVAAGLRTEVRRMNTTSDGLKVPEYWLSASS